MSLFRSSLRPPAIVSDETIERYLTAIRAEIDPDPLFRRRLRGHVVNRYVAVREGIVQRSPAKEMGRLGRAVLYASFVLGVSLTGAMAASQQAIPGDLFYPMKLGIESMRERVVPERLRDELAAYALGQRIDELHRLVTDGKAADAAAHVAAVEAAYDELRRLTPDAAAFAEHMRVAEALLERLPEQVKAALERALSRGPAADEPRDGAGGGGSPTNGNASGEQPSGAGAPAPDGPSHAAEPLRGPSDNPGEPSPGDSQASKEPKPTKSPKSEPADSSDG